MGRLREMWRILTAHDPYPGFVVDRYWNVVLANNAAQDMADVLPAELKGPPLNVFRAASIPTGWPLGR